MTAEDKELLIRDLCARLPYGIKGKCEMDASYDTAFDTITQYHIFDAELTGIKDDCLDVLPLIEDLDELEFANEEVADGIEIADFTPYLRPMSSMTEKEEAELYKMASSSLNDSFAIFDWLNKNYFAYRTIYNSEENKWENMFDKGLALVAPKEMYKIG